MPETVALKRSCETLLGELVVLGSTDMSDELGVLPIEDVLGQVCAEEASSTGKEESGTGRRAQGIGIGALVLGVQRLGKLVEGVRVDGIGRMVDGDSLAAAKTVDLGAQAAKSGVGIEDADGNVDAQVLANVEQELLGKKAVTTAIEETGVGPRNGRLVFEL